MLTDDEILDLVRECDIDWHAGWAGDDEDNRFARFARAVERAAAERMRERCKAACVAQASRWLTSSRDIYVALECAQAIAQLKIEESK